MERSLYEQEHQQFREGFRGFLEGEITPAYERWERNGIVDRAAYAAAGRLGYVGMAVPEQYGGAGVDDFRFNAVIAEECEAAGVGGFGLGLAVHTDICLPYFLRYASPEQQQRWLPGLARGELICAIAMSEPDAGSDLAGLRATGVTDGDGFRVNGAKTFITNGINADLVIAAVKTEPDAGSKGISLLVLERGMEGFERGRNLQKIGQHAQDTAELFFQDVRVPGDNLLGEKNSGFYYLTHNLAQERLGIAVAAIAAATSILGWTLEYVQQRRAFGRAVADFQHTRFALAELATEIDIAQTYVDRCITARNAEVLSGEDAAKAKWWCTELQGRVADVCVQLHGGYGYMAEYPVARAWADARATRIYGGTNEIMKEIVARSLGLR
jgi:alkylation response protein AidB-like acyl-CoA dehydrogenase